MNNFPGISFGLEFNPDELKLIRAIPNHSEPIRKSFCVSFYEKWREINLTQSDSFRLNPRHQSE